MAIKTLPIELDAQPMPIVKSKRGFAGMSAEKRLEISRRGGAALKTSYAFQKNRELASAAGRIGGKKSKRKKAVQP